MTGILVAVIAFAAALGMYALGLWQGRHVGREEGLAEWERDFFDEQARQEDER